jgi:folate-binding Fe-S cluster repair protein YgfZ
MTRQLSEVVAGAEIKRSVKESEILATCRELLRLHGWFVVRFQQGLGCHKGLSDLAALKAGKVLWIEIKTSKGRLSRHQQQFRCDIMRHGGTYLVIDNPDDLEAALQWLEQEVAS